MGGQGGAYRVSPSGGIVQLQEADKQALSRQVDEARREMAQKALNARLKQVRDVTCLLRITRCFDVCDVNLTLADRHERVRSPGVRTLRECGQEGDRTAPSDL